MIHHWGSGPHWFGDGSGPVLGSVLAVVGLVYHTDRPLSCTEQAEAGAPGC